MTKMQQIGALLMLGLLLVIAIYRWNHLPQ